MSDSYQRAKGGRLTFKDGSVASRSKSIDKKKKKKKAKKHDDSNSIDDGAPAAPPMEEAVENAGDSTGTGGEIYTIDAAKRMKYEELFPVESKKFGYQDKVNFKSVEDALDDRVKKKADRYCK